MVRLVVKMEGVGSVEDLKTICSKQIRDDKYEAEIVKVDGAQATVEVTGSVKLFRYDVEAFGGEVRED